MKQLSKLDAEQGLVADVRSELIGMADIGVLSRSSAGALGSIVPELKHTLLYVQHFRTRPEMENSVLVDAKFPTPDAKFWQAVREQNVMFVNLCELAFDYRTASAKIKLLKAQAAKLQSEPIDNLGYERDEREARVELLNIKIERQEFNLVQMRLTAEHRAREVMAWSNIKNELLPVLKHGTESCETHQPESYLRRFTFNVKANEHAGWKGAGTAEVVNLLSQFDNLRRDKGNEAVAKELGVYDEKAPLRQMDIIQNIVGEHERKLAEGGNGRIKLEKPSS